MSTSDDELEGLLRRTRARRELINARKAAWGKYLSKFKMSVTFFKRIFTSILSNVFFY